MTTAPTQSDKERARLGVLDSYGVVGVDLGPEFDDLLRLAQGVLGAPVVIFSFVGADRLTFGARIGTEARELGREGAFCAEAILDPEGLVVPDARLDARFADSPLVTHEPRLRFYAGAPMFAPEGAALGNLCVLDTAPRHDFSADKRATLRALARLAMERLDTRRQGRRAADGRKGLEAITALSPDAVITADGANRILSWNRAAEATFGHRAHEAIGQSLSMIVPPALRAMHEAGIARAVAGEPARIIGCLVTVPALRRDGTEFPIELSLTHWTEAGEHRFGAIVRDATDRVREEERLRREAALDHLTGIANRKALAAALEAASRSGGGTLLLLDLDGFKDVNDSLGHAAGDEVLRVVARRLGEEAPEARLVSRLGGDEFAILMAAGTDGAAACAHGRRLVGAIERPVEIGERCIYVGASGGVAAAEGGGWDPDALLAEADVALYRAKADGCSSVRLFTPDLHVVAQARRSVSSGLREAWDRGEFEMHFQPQVRLDDRTVTGAEALIRWNHPERGLIGPAAFLPVLESSLLVGPVSAWILRAACAQAARCRALGLPRFRVGVNLFSAQFRSGDLPRRVDEALAGAGLPADALELEITENTILENDSRIAGQLADLRDLGVGIAFDDYGTGYASLTMLKAHPVTRLKIDRSFVSGVDRGRRDQAIVEAIATLAAGFDLHLIAEGIETEEQAALMRPYCQEGQGFLFGRPMAGDQFEATCRAGDVARSWRHSA